MNETRIRTALKVVTWRIAVSLTTIGTTWFVTGSLAAGGGVALLNLVVNTVLYMAHERAWQQFDIGYKK